MVGTPVRQSSYARALCIEAMQPLAATLHSSSMSVALRYQQQLANKHLTEDPDQAEVVALLDDLLQRLAGHRPPGHFKRWFGGTHAPERGLYLWGGVGRGKTLLMDLFYGCLPSERKLRMHFHRFMHRVHDDLTSLVGTPDPLQVVADRLASDADVLCFDEFFVSDIGDAMLLGELMTGMFDRGVTLVATSNVEPDRLYANGLQRRRFLPAIDVLKRHTLVHHVGGDVDFRLRVLERAEIYHSPLDANAEQTLSASFQALAPDTPRADVDLEVEGRLLRAKRVADDVAWFEFAELCEGPRSQNDYIELARCFHAVLVSNVKCFTSLNEDAARRFISLVDEFYDHNVKLILSAEAPIAELYAGERLRFEFERTESRLTEMQSHDYLARSHRP